MKAIHWIIAALAFVQSTPASAATTDPEVIIYRFPGVRDTGGAGFTGVATSFHCTNFSGATETVRMVLRDTLISIVSNNTYPLPHLGTLTVSTRPISAYLNDLSIPFLAPVGMFGQGTVAIAATSINIICTAMTINAANSDPVGVALRGIRFSPVPGSQE